jgi:hypothetical protein
MEHTIKGKAFSVVKMAGAPLDMVNTSRPKSQPIDHNLLPFDHKEWQGITISIGRPHVSGGHTKQIDAALASRLNGRRKPR